MMSISLPIDKIKNAAFGPRFARFWGYFRPALCFVNRGGPTHAQRVRPGGVAKIKEIEAGRCD
jgi:hypothetical protein